MEEAGQIAAPKGAGIRQLAVKGAFAGIATAVVSFALAGPAAAIGAVAGAGAAVAYAFSYLQSHIRKASRNKMFDPGLAGAAAGRMLGLAAAAGAVYLLGRHAFMAYLVGFAVVFGLLLVTQLPGAYRSAKAQMGGR